MNEDTTQPRCRILASHAQAQDVHNLCLPRFEAGWPALDMDEQIAHAQRKRVIYPWNEWGQRLSYAQLTSVAALVDHWPDPAFNHGDEPWLWLRAEVWRHPDGTHFRTLLHNNGTIVVDALECCHRPDAAQLEPLDDAPPHLDAGTKVKPDRAVGAAQIDAALMPADETRIEKIHV